MLQEIQGNLNFNNNKVGYNSICLDTRLKQNSPYDDPLFNITCVDYVNGAMNNQEEAIQDMIRKFPIKTMKAIIKTYKLELDGSPKLEGKQA